MSNKGDGRVVTASFQPQAPCGATLGVAAVLLLGTPSAALAFGAPREAEPPRKGTPAGHLRLGMGYASSEPYSAGPDPSSGLGLVMEGGAGIHVSRRTVVRAVAAPAFGLTTRSTEHYGRRTVPFAFHLLIGPGLAFKGELGIPFELDLFLGPAHLAREPEPHWGWGYMLGLAFPRNLSRVKLGPWVQWRASVTDANGLELFFPSGGPEDTQTVGTTILSGGAQLSF